MFQFRTQFINHKVLFRKKLKQKHKKEEIVPQNFGTVYSAVNARLKRSNIKHLIASIWHPHKIKLSHSDKILLGNRDAKESIADFVCALKRRNTDFRDIYFTILEAIPLTPKLVIHKNAKAKNSGIWIPFKIVKGKTKQIAGLELRTVLCKT